MDLKEITNKLVELESSISEDSFIYDLLLTYGVSKSYVTRKRNSKDFKEENENTVIFKKKVFFKVEKDKDIHLTLGDLRDDPVINKYKPRFILVTDFKDLVAVDLKVEETLDLPITEIHKRAEFFLPIAGQEKYREIIGTRADQKASEKMAKLYDIILKENEIDGHEQRYDDLNIFLARILFCFFAEDTEIFTENSFTHTLGSVTQNGKDLNIFLKNLFEILNLPENSPQRKRFPEVFHNFPYVNGGLFEKSTWMPTLSDEARKIILENGSLDWAEINPDIFGSMIQAVVRSDPESDNTEHYTSVENIMKVIQPLFLDELYDEFEKAKGNTTKLQKLLGRISNIRIFDPACGSGNFLIITYKELRKLEMEILEELQGLYLSSQIQLIQFYGIELNHFSVEIAKLSLWLTEHQMNIEFKERFGKTKPTLPLSKAGHIVSGNAARINWRDVCPQSDEEEIYIIGNPPFGGSRKISKEQKEDLKYVFKRDYKSLDYVSIWYYKSAEFLQYQNVQVGLVSTNSISQGLSVSLFWKRLFSEFENVEIHFAYQSFKWTNNARGNAGVTCVIIGMNNKSTKKKYIFTSGSIHTVENITPYLVEGKTTFIKKASKPITKCFPKASYGNMPNDGGNLILSDNEKSTLVNYYPQSEYYINRYIGGSDYLNNKSRWCLNVRDEDVNLVTEIPEIRMRFEKVRKTRLKSSETSTRKKADKPNQFYFWIHEKGQSIIIPRTTSERRKYISAGLFNEDSVISDSAVVIYTSKLYVFGVISSRMHMVWVKAVGGRLKTDIRYSSTLCYNTFPFPEITERQKERIKEAVYGVLDAREMHSEMTIAQMYDPDKMPDDLRGAHQNLDRVIERCYRTAPFKSDRDRLEYLFEMYESMTKNDK